MIAADPHELTLAGGRHRRPAPAVHGPAEQEALNRQTSVPRDACYPETFDLVAREVVRLVTG
jgi:hypothetical protein